MGLTSTNGFTPNELQLIEFELLAPLGASMGVGPGSAAWPPTAHEYLRESSKWTPTAHEYLRVSVDGSGIEESQRQQHEENEQHREQYKWLPGKTYKDTGSASVYARKVRDDFEQLIKDLQTGAVFKTGDVLRLWESSRGSREQEEWARFLNLLRDRRVFLYVTSHRRLYDLHNPRDRRSLDEDGVDSAYESAKTSLRIRRDKAAHAARAGRLGGLRWATRGRATRTRAACSSRSRTQRTPS